jgi:hypothetical protein
MRNFPRKACARTSRKARCHFRLALVLLGVILQRCHYLLRGAYYGETLSKNYGVRLAQGPLQSLKALDPDLRNPDFEAADTRNLRNHAKPNMYRFGSKKMAREARQRSLHNAGKFPAPTGARNRLCNFPCKARARTSCKARCHFYKLGL